MRTLLSRPIQPHQPAVYRTVIDDVITQIRPEFDQLGVEEAVLQELLRLWELKLAQSRAADFSHDARMGPVAKQFPPLSPAEVAALNEGKVHCSLSITLRVMEEADEKGEQDVKKEKDNGAKPKKEGEGDDEDAINSDLDDEDDLDDDEDADGVEQGGDLVIALYEKVQRVKNKWKVTLKDGLVSVNGKEYLFAKCNGEFEW
ncbi:hypothetical protein JCM10207_002861 [Rhodosporidiobolus poonsookiae]